MKEKERETEIALKRRKRWRWGSCSKLGWGGQKQSERGEGIRRERYINKERKERHREPG